MFCSVITVNRNNASGLEKTIRSVMAQCPDLFEFIVVDGASTDGSLDVLSRYKHLFARMISEPDQGVYDAMNKGLSYATGDYILFMNSGDSFCDADVLQRVYEYPEKTDIMIGGVNLIRHGKKIGVEIPDFSLTAYTLLYRSICHQATFVCREVFNQTGMFRLDLKIVADWCIVFLALARYNKSARILPFCIADYDVTGISSGKLSGDTIRAEKDFFLQENFPFFYSDYQKMHQIFRWSFPNIMRYIKWRLSKK